MHPSTTRPQNAYADLKPADVREHRSSDVVKELLGEKDARRPEALMEYFLHTSPTSVG
jgi:predicted CopG family antitoxin